MNNIKFLNSKDKANLYKIYNEDFVLNLIDILNFLKNRYQISKAVVTGIDYGYDYDTLNIYIKSSDYETKKYIIMIDTNEMKLIAKRINSKNYECFNIFENECLITKKGYETSKRVILEKIYLNNNNEENNRKLVYNYFTPENKFLVVLTLPKSFFINEDMFLSSLCMNQEEIKKPVDLYLIIRDLFRTDKFQVTIKNIKTSEMITIRDSKLINYVENKTEGELEYTINYRNGDCSITHKVLEPSSNTDIKKIIKKIKK